MFLRATPEAEWKRTYGTIKATHDDVYRVIERAIKLEERERPDLALQDYKEGIRLIDVALAIPVEIPEDCQSDETWDQAVRMIHKMKCTRGEVLQRIGQLGSKRPAPPSGESNTVRSEPENEANGAAESRRPWTYTELARALRTMPQCGDGSSTITLELLFSCDGVRMYYIEPDGVVSRTLTDSTLRIVRIGEDDAKMLEATVFLQVIETIASTRIENAEQPLEQAVEATEDTELAVEEMAENVGPIDPSFIYPLIPGVSPCYRTEFGAFLVPDLNSTEGRTIGLVIPPGADDVVLEIFVAFLHGFVTQGGAIHLGDVPKRKRSTSAAVSANLIKGAYYVSQGLVKGAEKTGQLISYSTPYLMAKIGKGPNEAPAQIPSNVRTGIEIAKSVTGTAANVTSYVAGKVGSATMAMGRFLAPHIQKHGSNLLSYSTGISAADASETMDGALTICAGAVEGFGTIYDGLERSASILGTSLSNSTVKIVEHKYGSDAGQVVGSSLDTVGNVINVSHNVTYITPKGLAKRTAKNAGKALVSGYRPSVPELDGAGPSGGQTIAPQQHIIPAASLYPDLSGLAQEVQQRQQQQKMES